MFKNRAEAGKKLAEKLAKYRGQNVVVLALPRGGIVVGFEVAGALGFPLDIIAVRKIGHPYHPEYAIGAVDKKGTRILNEYEAGSVDQKWLAEETKRQQEEAVRRSRVYRGERAPVEIAGKTVILTDDGIATSLTMRLAVRVAKEQRALKIVVAVPVAPEDSLQALRSEGVEELIVLEPPEEFQGAVGAHYVHFDQVEDEEVIRLLHMAHGAGDRRTT